MANRGGVEDGMDGGGDGNQDSPNQENNRNSKVIVYYDLSEKLWAFLFVQKIRTGGSPTPIKGYNQDMNVRKTISNHFINRLVLEEEAVMQIWATIIQRQARTGYILKVNQLTTNITTSYMFQGTLPQMKLLQHIKS